MASHRVADCYGILGSLDEREGQHHDAALNLAKEYQLRGGRRPNGGAASLAVCLSSNARVLRSLGRYDESLEFSSKALEVFRGVWTDEAFP